MKFIRCEFLLHVYYIGNSVKHGNIVIYLTNGNKRYQIIIQEKYRVAICTSSGVVLRIQSFCNLCRKENIQIIIGDVVNGVKIRRDTLF